jgi:hypothetical protein
MFFVPTDSCFSSKYMIAGQSCATATAAALALADGVTVQQVTYSKLKQRLLQPEKCWQRATKLNLARGVVYKTDTLVCVAKK